MYITEKQCHYNITQSAFATVPLVWRCYSGASYVLNASGGGRGGNDSSLFAGMEELDASGGGRGGNDSSLFAGESALSASKKVPYLQARSP